MRKTVNINDNWHFSKEYSSIPAVIPKSFEEVTIPHTWNNIDGTDGGNDYYRGKCIYLKEISKKALPKSDKYFLEIKGANSSSEVFLNGKKLFAHDGGYSAFRVDITEALKENNILAVTVDNSPNDYVYPQMADFTFYGGLYRDVNIICVASSHFTLEYYGSCGIMVTPEIAGKDAKVEVQLYITNHKETQEFKYSVYDNENNLVTENILKENKFEFTISDVHLWDGIDDPYLYYITAELIEEGIVIDNIKTHFGCRSFEITPDRGFILNGREYPLRGVSRHQDRQGLGNALLPKHHKEDIKLILEMGANTIRLAHYQHDSYFYDLCDRYGLIVWAEIPYISKHLPKAKDNTISQMKELFYQNYNRPSVVVWGLSNEISMNGSDSDLVENHIILNDMVHDIDKTRPTAIAAVSMAKTDDPYIHISDVVSYNHYFGWYGGDTSMNGPWLDNFHKKYPDTPIGLSEYGCEGLNWHTSNPVQGDYTEEYQAYYHEELIKQLFTRKYLWATHVWNMFDFGADARAEGGENGQNHKGLITFDRKYKKDAFYAYKAWLSKEPFVHICSKRYIDRVEDKTKITVYSNCPEVELFVNGKSVGVKRAENHFFKFKVENKGESHIVARSGSLYDQSIIRKVEKPNEDYVLKEKGAVLNWFDVDAPEGRFSLNDKIADIIATEKGKTWFSELGLKLKKIMPTDENGKTSAIGFEIGPDMLSMLGGFTVLRFTNMMGMMNVNFTKEELLKMNAQLNEIEKSE